MNKVILIGRLSRDVESRYTQSGTAVSTFSLAVNRVLTKEQKTNGMQSADFINCVAWGRTAEVLAQYCHKGSRIAIEGRLQVRNYTTQDGTKRYATEVIVEQMEMLDSKSAGNNTGGTYIADEEIPF